MIFGKSLREIGLKRLIIMLVCGIVLVIISFSELLSSNKPKEIVQVNNEKDNEDYITLMEERLENILKKVNGIKDVDVMITLKESGEEVVLKDTPTDDEKTKDSSSYKADENTIVFEGESGEESPYVIKEVQPKIEGVVVIADMEDNSQLTSEINSAVEVLFDIPAHKIIIMKMNE